MSNFHVEVVTLENVYKHPNADSLSVGEAAGAPVIFRTGEYTQGQPVVYIPIDAIMPSTPEWDFLGTKRRIKAKKLRGIFSCGMLSQPRADWVLGQNVQSELGIEKYDPDTDAEMSMLSPKERYDRGKSPFALEMNEKYGLKGVPKYDLEAYRKYKLFQPGEQVVAFEKIHGQNARFVYSDGQLYVASKSLFRPVTSECFWWRAARRHNLEERLKDFPEMVVYAEVYGNNSDLHYGALADNGERMAVFDMYDRTNERWVESCTAQIYATHMGLPWVPEVYRGPWYDGLATELADGPSLLAQQNGADHFREGVVIRHAVEQNHPLIGRVVLKAVGQMYLLRNKA